MSTEAIPPDHVTEEAAAPPTAAANKPASGTGNGMTMSTTLSSMGQLREEAPAVYKAMLEGIAFKIVREMKEHGDRLKSIIREQDQR